MAEIDFSLALGGFPQMSLTKPFVGLLGVAMLITLIGCGDSSSDSGAGDTVKAGPSGGTVKAEGPIKLAYVTNGIASFWDVAKSGAEAGAAEFDCEVEVRMPDGPLDQKDTLEDMLSQGIDGVAVSPIDPENQTAFLNKLGGNTFFITHDSDAPESNRRFYVGMDNYDAGRLCGQLVKEAIPDGGEVLITVGRLEQLNAKLRRQGVIDEWLDRERQPGVFDPQEGVIKGDKYTIVATETDGFDNVKAKEQAQDALVQYPELKCMVGLFAYNPPLLLAAARDAGKLDQVKIVGFDEDAETLAAIRDGEIHSTVVQNPYEYGRMSVEVLYNLVRGNEDKLPSEPIVYIPARQIRKDNVIEFWTDLNEKLGQDPPQ
jgi:ribose transport system substrate-binding protein